MKIVSKRLLKQSVYLNGRKAVIVTPTNIRPILCAHIYDVTDDGTLVPSDPEVHTKETLKEFLAHYNTRKVDKHLVLA
jgi:hypothetical protein